MGVNCRCVVSYMQNRRRTIATPLTIAMMAPKIAPITLLMAEPMDETMAPFESVEGSVCEQRYRRFDAGSYVARTMIEWFTDTKLGGNKMLVGAGTFIPVSVHCGGVFQA